MKLILAVSITLSACTTLGPMPATTAVSAIPTGRPGFEAQAGAVPAFYLSRAAADRSGGAPIPQLSALADLDRWLGVPGLIVGARLFGQSQDTPGEPFIGYRRKIDDVLSLGGVVFGTSKESTRALASYHASQIGAEVMGDARLWAPAEWFGVHLHGSVSATRIAASGTYCANPDGVAIDCNQQDVSKNTMIDGSLHGVFAAGTVALALDFGRNATGTFHSARLAIIAATGQMPLMKAGMQETTDYYTTLGLTFTLGVGAPD
jgi:hypothetical protein